MITFGEQCMKQLVGEAEKLGRKLKKEEAAAIITTLFNAACPAKRRLVNGRNLLFDAFVGACELDAAVTKTQAGLIAKCCVEVADTFAKEVATEEIVGEIQRRAAAYRRKYSTAALTPGALVKHWAEFRRPAPKAQLPKAPSGWLPKLNRKYPDTVYSKGGIFEITEETDYNWSQLHPWLREELEK